MPNDPSPTVVVPFEQAVYGSFAFRGDGYAMLSQSPGCRPEWLADFRSACRRIGAKPAATADSAGLFALRLPSGPWAVVGLSPQGRDDRGRPGALAFHGLFVSPRGYRRGGADPFAFAPWLRSDWSGETQELAAGTAVIKVETETETDPTALAVATALTRRRRVAVESAGPIDDLARRAWRALPKRTRARASLATWAFGNDNRFDLLAVPRLAGVTLDRSYVDPSTLPINDSTRRHISIRAAVGVGLTTFLGVAAVSLALIGDDDEKALDGRRATRSTASLTADAPQSRPPTPRAAESPAERRRVAQALDALAARFGDALDKTISGPVFITEPADAMEGLARGLRYRGPHLSDPERDRLRRDPGRDAALALRWDESIHRFDDDHPLPDDFRLLPLRDQLAALRESFHLAVAAEPDGPRPALSEIVDALGEALAADVPARPTALVAAYPALGPYRSFLGRLPRR